MHGPQYVRPLTSVNSPIWVEWIVQGARNDAAVILSGTRAARQLLLGSATAIGTRWRNSSSVSGK